MEIIRLLLLQCESGKQSLELADYAEPLIVYNAALIIEAGLAVGHVIEDGDGMPSGATIMRLTWDGHDFLDATKNSKLWALAKKKILEPGAAWTFSILLEYLKAEGRKRFLGEPPPAP